MRTTIDIPDALLQQALKTFKVKTKREAVIYALNEQIRRARILTLHEKMKGRIPDLKIDLDILRERGRSA